MAFLSELAANLSAHNIPMTIYSGNDDAISPHFGTECMSFCLSSC
jgi:carboxypeptidase D